MTITIVLVVAYLLFMTTPGQKFFGWLVRNVAYCMFIIVNPISLICGLGIYLIVKGL